MHLFRQRIRQTGERSVIKRMCALVLVLALLLEISGTLPGFLLSPLVTKADAAVSFTYQPGSMGAAVLPRDDVFSLARLRTLEEANPSVVLNINSKFSLQSSSNLLSGAPSLGGTLSGAGNWKANYQWNPKNDQKVKDHLLNQAMDLELLWTGSYKRTDKGNPSAQVWYYGNEDYLLIYARSYYNLRIGRGSFVELQGGEFSAGASGAVKSGSTGAVPLSYNRIAKKSRWELQFDSKGRIVYDSNGAPIWVEHPYTEYYPTVAGEHLKVKPTMGPPNMTSANGIQFYDFTWLNTAVNVTLSGANGTSISDTKMRLRDNAAPFLTAIQLNKNGSAVNGDAFMKSGDTLDIVLVFNEEIRFADNAGTDHGLKLRLSFVDKSNGVSDSESWVEADLISLVGNTMTFRFDPSNSQSGKELPDEFYVDGISAAAQAGWTSATEDFPLSLIDANGNTVVTGSSCCGIVTDLAGNPFEKFNVTRFDGNAKAHYDVLAPFIYKTVIWTSNFSEGEAASGLNPNEIEPDKLFLKAGDTVNLKIIFSEELNSRYAGWQEGTKLTDSSGNDLTPTATLNVTRNGSPVSLSPRRIGTIDSKSIDVTAAKRQLTVIEYEALTVTDGMELNGDYFMVTAVSDLNSMCDPALNPIKNLSIPLIAHQQRIDTTPPVIQVGETVDDTLDLDVFTVPLTISDAGSGTEEIQFRLLGCNAAENHYLWTVDANAAIVHRESDEKTADTSGWSLSTAVCAEQAASAAGWQNVIAPVGATQMYLHVKLLNTSSPGNWGYWLSEAPGEADNTHKTVTKTNIQIKASDIKKNQAIEDTGELTHAVGLKAETVVSFSGVRYTSGKATISVTVTNPMGVQRIVWGSSESAMTNVEYAGDLKTSHSFDVEYTTGTSGTVTLYVAAFGPTGAAKVNSIEASYDYTAGTLSYEKTLGDEKEPLFGLPSLRNLTVTENNRTMVLIDKGDGSFFATTEKPAAGSNLLAASANLTWYEVIGTANADYSVLNVSSVQRTNAQTVASWLGQYYGKVTFVLLNQHPNMDNGEGGWDYNGNQLPGSYNTANGIACAVEYAYLANGAAFTVTPGVVYADTETAVPAAVLSGSPGEPHSDLSDYSFTVALANTKDASSNQFYGLRIVQSAEAELLHSSDGTNYETVRTVELSVGSTTNLRFTKADGAASGWYKVVYRFTVNGQTTEAIVASGVYLDDTSAITPDVVSYNRSFDLWVREPMWKYAAYFIVDYSYYSHQSVASDSDITDGEIVKIGVAPIEVPEDKMADGVTLIPPLSNTSALNSDEQYLDRYYLADNEVNALTFRFAQTDPEAGSAALSRIGGTNHFYVWSGNDPDGRANARANWQTFTVGTDLTLTVTDGTSGFDYSEGKLPLTDGYNLIHYVVEYESGETVEQVFLADVRTTAMDLGLDVYYHAADQYISDEQLAAVWAVYQDLENEDGTKLYPTQQDYLDSIGAVETTVSTSEGTRHCYVVVGPKCTDEADLYHRNEAVVSPVLNDYDAAIASSFMSYRHLDGELTERTDPETPKQNPMEAERFRKSSAHELFFAEDVYGNMSFAATAMDAIDGEAPVIEVASSFANYDFSDIIRGAGYADDAFLYDGYDILLHIEDDSALNLSSLQVSFDPAYSQVLDPTLDGEYETITMDLPLCYEKDDCGFFKPWEISEGEAGRTGGITMTCLTMDLGANPDSPQYKTINGVEIQGGFKPCTVAGDVTLTFTLTDAYGNACSYPMVFHNNSEDEYGNTYRIMSEDYALVGSINDNSGWYEGYIERDADGNAIDIIYLGYNELPDWAPEPQYCIGDWGDWEGMNIQIDYDWVQSVRDQLPELDPYGVGSYFTNEGYAKVGVVTASQVGEDFRQYLPYALSVESYQTDYGVFTDGWVRTRNFDKLTGRFGSSASSYQTEQAIILPSVSENGVVTVNWTDVFGTKHTSAVSITAFGSGTDNEMDVRATFSPATRTNEDVLVTLKGGRVKDENGKTTTCEITGITVTLQDGNGTSFDATDPRVSIYTSQPWNATVLMPSNGTISVEYRYPGSLWNDDTWESIPCNDETAAENDCYYEGSRVFCVSTIDKTPPTPTVTYVYVDTGELVVEGVTETDREIRAEVTADEPIEGVEGGLSCVFSYGAALGDTQRFTVRDRAGNTAEVTAVCPAAINAPEPTGENKAPTATIYLSANLGGIAKSIGTFTLSADGVTELYTSGETEAQTVNLNEQTVADINAAIANNLATLYTLRFEINDEAPAACTVTSSDPSVAEVGANNTVTVRNNGTFTLTVLDNANNASHLQNIVVDALDTEAPAVTPIYGLYTAQDGTQRVRVAFKPENDEQIYPIVTGDQSSRDILSTLYDVYAPDGTVCAQRTGFFTDFERNEDYTFYYKDAYGNASSVSVQVRGMDTEAPAFSSILWNGTVNNLTPDTEGAGPTGKNVTAILKTDKALSSVDLHYYAEDAENHVGGELSPQDAEKVRMEFSANLIEVTWTDNLESSLILSAKSASSGLTAYYTLPVIGIIDKTAPTITLNSATLAEDKASKEFRFTVSGAEGEVFVSNLAVTYTVTTENGVEIVTPNAIGVKGTEFIYTARTSNPVTLRFIDDAGNSTDYPLTEAMLSDVDAATLSVSFNTVASEEGATKNLSELALTGTTVYVYPSKNATITLIDDPENDPEGSAQDPSKVWTANAKTWTQVTLSATANIQMLKFDDLNTGKSTYAWLVSDADRVAPAISYTGEDTVFATTEMTLSAVQSLLLSDVSAYDGVDGAIDPATITVTGCSTAAGLHTVTYSAHDAAGNEAELERNLYVKGQYDPIVQVNGRDTVPLGTVIVTTKEITLTACCALEGDNSVYLAIRPGIMTAARMKYSTDYGINSLSYTAPKAGFYTLLARNRDRTEVLLYIYVEESH